MITAAKTHASKQRYHAPIKQTHKQDYLSLTIPVLQHFTQEGDILEIATLVPEFGRKGGVPQP